MRFAGPGSQIDLLAPLAAKGAMTVGGGVQAGLPALRTFDPVAIAEAKAHHDEVLRRLQALGTGATSGAAGAPQKSLDQYRQEGYGIVPNQ